MRVQILRSPIAELVLPASLLCLLLGVVAIQLGVVPLPQPSGLRPQTVVLDAAPFAYRAVGDYQQAGAPVDAPLINVALAPKLEIMRYHVTAAAYDQCVLAGGCKAAAPNVRSGGDVPVTGVSFEDATQYARWLSAETGETWRLPTAAEWNFAAGVMADDHVIQAGTVASNPAARWLSFYEQEAAAKVDIDPVPRASGAFGFNDNGLADIAANVWEWTSTCVQRTTLGTDGAVTNVVESCGLRYLEGRHRSPMNVFVRDARGGGCSVGVPPANLGFRLVRETPWYSGMLEALGLA